MAIIPMSEENSPISSKNAFLHALRLASPALPVGAFSYSQGLETAVENEWVNDADSLLEWTQGIIEHTLLYTDLPILRHCFQGWEDNDYATIQIWNDRLLAYRETEELYYEDINVGSAMQRHLQNLQLKEFTDQISPPYAYATLFALAGCHWKLSLDLLCQSFAWSWAENQVAAAIKLFPLGQTKGQQVLCDLIPIINRVSINSADIDDNSIGASCYGMSIASMQHETQYSRLFRS